MCGVESKKPGLYIVSGEKEAGCVKSDVFLYV